MCWCAVKKLLTHWWHGIVVYILKIAIVLHDKFDSWQEFQDKLDAYCKKKLTRVSYRMTARRWNLLTNTKKSLSPPSSSLLSWGCHASTTGRNANRKGRCLQAKDRFRGKDWCAFLFMRLAIRTACQSQKWSSLAKSATYTLHIDIEKHKHKHKIYLFGVAARSWIKKQW